MHLLNTKTLKRILTIAAFALPMLTFGQFLKPTFDDEIIDDGGGGLPVSLSITGPSAVSVGDVEYYNVTVLNGSIGTPSYMVSKGTKLSETTSRVRVQWTYAGAGSVRISTQINGNFYFASQSVTIVAPILAPPTITASADPICMGSSVTLTSAGSVYDKWYSAATGGTLLNTGNTYAPSPSQTTTYYVAGGDASGQESLLRTAITVNVDAAPLAGMISASENNLCGGEVTFTRSGASGSIVDWQYNYHDGDGVWSDWTVFNTSNDVSVSRNFPAVSGFDRTYTIRLGVSKGVCAIAYTETTLVITSTDELIAGTITGGDVSLCEGEPMPLLTASGYSGGNGVHEFQWRHRIWQGAFFGWSDIIGETSDSYQVPDLDYTEDRKHRLEISSCGSTVSTPTIEVEVLNNPTGANPGTLTSNVSGQICPLVEIDFSFAVASGFSPYYTRLEGFYNNQWNDYGQISSSMTVQVHKDEKFRVKYENTCGTLVYSNVKEFRVYVDYRG